MSVSATFERPDVIAGATLRSGPRGDCLLHIPATSEMSSKASPCARLLYVQRPVFFREASAESDSSAVPPGIRNERSLEAQASVIVTGGTISAADGNLALPWLGQLSNFFAIGTELQPCKLWAPCLKSQLDVSADLGDEDKGSVDDPQQFFAVHGGRSH